MKQRTMNISTEAQPVKAFVTPRYYGHQCVDTGRTFVCRAGVDNNVAETFEHDGLCALDWADKIASLLNKEKGHAT
jgi:hypothetical protein